MDASVLTFLGLVNDLRRVEECFRGDTANIKTNPTQGRITLNENDFLTKISRTKGRRVASWTAAKDQNLGVERQRITHAEIP